MKRFQILLISFVFLISLSNAEELIYPFGYDGGSLSLGLADWDHIHDSFDFPCSGPADLPSTECYGVNPDGKESFTLTAEYSILEFSYSCEPYDYEGGCWYGNECYISYSGYDYTSSVSVVGDSLSVIDPDEDYFSAKLIKGSVEGYYQCVPCGHGEWVYYVRPTKCEVDVYAKTFDSCDSFCKTSIQSSTGKEEDGECKCYCGEGYEKYQREDGSWMCNYVYDEQIVLDQLKKDYHECIFALMLYKQMTLYATVDQGQVQPAYYEDISDNPGLAVPKWLWKSGCTADYVGLPVDVCLAQHCSANYKVPLQELGGSVSTVQYDKKQGSIIEEPYEKVIKVDYGSVHTYQPGVTIITPVGMEYQQSEVVVNVYEDGSSDIYVLEGEVTHFPASDPSSQVEITSGEKLSVSSDSTASQPTTFIESDLDQWWDSTSDYNGDDDFDDSLDDFFNDFYCCGGPVFLLLSLIAVSIRDERSLG